MSQWFEVDKSGLSKLLDKRGKVFALFELVQNAWDTDTREVAIRLTPVEGRPVASLEVEDQDPEGFRFMEHAYTLFAESIKKGDPSKRGRFNLGEKLVLALCHEAEIVSTKGHVIFDAKGRRNGRERRERGSLFRAQIKMTREELAEVVEQFSRLIQPDGITTVLNGIDLKPRELVARFQTSLPTLVTNEEGELIRTKRTTEVRVYRALNRQPGAIYELGIPVVETGDLYDVDVQQKVPVNLDRDNVPPAYLRQLRALVLNETAGLLTKEQATETWVTDALHHPDAAPQAVEAVVTQRFGEKRAIFDPNDPEANNRLVSQGYTVIHGGTFGRGAWDNIRSSGAVKPSGVLAPTPKPYSLDPNAKEVDVVDPDKWTDGIRGVVELARRLGLALLQVEVEVTVVRTTNGFAACYGYGNLDLNLMRLGHDWFNGYREHRAKVLDLLLHEFAHHYEANHLSEGYHDALSSLGARLAVLVLNDPKVLG